MFLFIPDSRQMLDCTAGTKASVLAFALLLSKRPYSARMQEQAKFCAFMFFFLDYFA